MSTNTYNNATAYVGSYWKTVGTVPAGKSWVVTSLTATNTTGQAVLATTRYLDSSASNAPGYLTNGLSVAGSATSALMLGKLVLAAGDALQVRANLDAVGELAGENIGSSLNITNIAGMAYGGSRLVISDGNANIVYSDNLGSTWVYVGKVSTGSVTCMAYGGGLFVTHNGTNFLSSVDGITWTTRTAATATLWRIIHNGTVFVGVGAAGAIYSSPDGITWTARTSGVSVALNDVAWSGSLFLATGAVSGAQPASVTSPDGITWTANTANIGSLGMQSVVWVSGHSKFYVAPGGGAIYSTSDGVTYANTGWSGPASTDVITDGTRLIALGSTGGAVAQTATGVAAAVRARVGPANKNSSVYAAGKLYWFSGGQLYSASAFTPDDAVSLSVSCSYVEVTP